MRGRAEEQPPDEGDREMTEPNSTTEPAGAGLSDEEMAATVAEQTDSASENADVAGKDWDGNPGSAPAPTDRA
jgi:hypothetical protein